jgi:hypothetical protein
MTFGWREYGVVTTLTLNFGVTCSLSHRFTITQTLFGKTKPSTIYPKKTQFVNGREHWDEVSSIIWLRLKMRSVIATIHGRKRTSSASWRETRNHQRAGYAGAEQRQMQLETEKWHSGWEPATADAARAESSTWAPVNRDMMRTGGGWRVCGQRDRSPPPLTSQLEQA